jgi:hypothetical protein
MTTNFQTGTSPSSPGQPDLDEICDVQSPAWQGAPWPLAPDEPVGQTFLARFDGLSAIEVLVARDPHWTGDLIVTLRYDGPGGGVIFQGSVPSGAVADNRYARFVAPPVQRSAGQRVYFELHSTTPGLGVYTTGSALLGNGTAFRHGQPIDGCLVFRSFAASPDARLAERREIEGLLAERAQLTHDLLAARLRIRQLVDERTTLQTRLAALLTRLLPPTTLNSEGNARVER